MRFSAESIFIWRSHALKSWVISAAERWIFTSLSSSSLKPGSRCLPWSSVSSLTARNTATRVVGRVRADAR
jgi:hypothetical protein